MSIYDVALGLILALLLIVLAGCSFPRCLCTCPHRSDAYLSYPDENAKQICRDFCEAACYDC